MHDTAEYNALSWVRQEINTSIRTVQELLLQFTANTEKQELLQDCAEALHQLRGALQVANLPGAELLAAGLESVFRALHLAGRLPSCVSPELLSQGMRLLSEYLADLTTSADDDPDSLQRQIAALQSVRNVIEQSVVVPAAPGVVPLPADVFQARAANDPENSRKMAHAARVRFQGALLSWYRNGLDEDCIKTLHSILAALLERAASEAEARIWWVAMAVTDAIQGGMLEETVSLKQLYGKIDRHIKRLVDGEQDDFSDTQSTKLLEELLDCLSAVEQTPDAGIISDVITAFDLAQTDRGAPNAAVDERCEQAFTILLSGHEPASSGDETAILQNLVASGDETTSAPSAGLQEIIRGISLFKESVEEYLKTGNASSRSDSVTVILRDIHQALVNAGLHRPANVIAALQQYVVDSMEATDAVPGENALEGFADAVCSVEFYLECLRDGRVYGDELVRSAERIMEELGVAVEPATDIGPGNADAGRGAARNDQARTIPITTNQVIDPDADSEIVAIFFDESAEELESLRHSIAGLAGRADRHECLKEIRRCFHTLKGNSRMLGAFALGDFAYYFEKLSEHIREHGLEADNALVELLEQGCDGIAQLLELARNPACQPALNVDEIAARAARVAGSHIPGTQDSTGNEEELAHSCHADQVHGAGNDSMMQPVLAGGVDEEIVEVFLEEASEVEAGLAGIIPDWVAAPVNDDALVQIRRSMHTLKGSGRTAGALLIGELAWSFEDLLNRVIDGSVQLDDDIVALVARLPAVLPQLIEQIRNGSEPVENISELMQQASLLAYRDRGTPVAGHDTDAQEPVVSKDTVIEESGSAVCEVPESDLREEQRSLLQIYAREAGDILRVLREYLEEGSESGHVTEPVNRALHTLSGISESAEVTSISALAAGLGRYFGNLYQLQCRVPAEALDVLRDSTAAVERLVEQLPVVHDEDAQIGALCDRIASLPIATEHGQALDATGQEYTGIDAEAADQMPADRAEAVPQTHVAAVPDTSLEEADPELFEVFLEEAAEVMEAGEKDLHAWAGNPDNNEVLEGYQRHLHTLKGSARMMNIAAIGDLTHALETIVTRVSEATINVSADMFSALFVAQDKLAEMLELVRQRRMPGAAVELQEALERLARVPGGEECDDDGVVAISGKESRDDVEGEVEIRRETAEAGGNAEDAVPEAQALLNDDHAVDATPACLSATTEPDMRTPEAEHRQEEAHPVAQTITGESSAANGIEHSGVPLGTSEIPQPEQKRESERRRGEPVKVHSELLDDLVNYSGEINIYRTRMETQIGDYKFNLRELEQTISRLREQLRKLEMETETQILYRYEHESDSNQEEFDPLELDRYSSLQETSRSLLESINDLYSLLGLMENTTHESEALLLQQSRVSAALQEGLMRTRMTPFAGLETRLKRIVRQSAGQLNKRAELVLEGAEGEMDRAVIDRIIAPLEHMLRNAVAHGIETPEQRLSRGKEEAGKITIAFDREGPDIVLRIMDDGSGMNVDAIREKAVEKGMLDPSADVPDSDVTQFVLQTGFSTASEVTQISGRGVGLDVVNSEVKQLGGSLHIESTTGAGTSFTLRLPYTLAVNQALLVEAGAEAYCIPLGNVEGVVRAQPEELLACYAEDEPVYGYAGNLYQLKHLATLLDASDSRPDSMPARVPVLLMRVGEKRVALHVDALYESREIVIKPVGVQLGSIDGISGATILGDGRVVMILDVFALLRSNNMRAQLPAIWARKQEERRMVVLVVDDSITVRKVTTRLLERNGYKVLTAKDGVDAIGMLQGSTPDIMLLDIEMPRMDGFELATHMRNDERLRHVPIVMITSRTGDKHRERARKIGVNHYLGKPYQETDLLEKIDYIIRALPDGSADHQAGAQAG